MTKARDNSKFGNFAGNEVFLDSDKDTSITADTDDQIDIKVGGNDRVTINAAGDVSAVSFTGDGSALTGLSGGTIVKVAADEITAVSDGSGTFQDTGLEVTITPASTSNKILLLATGSVALSNTTCAWRFTQNGTAVGIGDTPASNTLRQRTSWKTTITNLNGSQNFVGSCILSPNSTSALTYKVQIESSADATWRINQSWNFSNSDDASHAVTSSYLYAIELDGSNTTIST